MKNIFKISILFFSSLLFSEEYICSGSLEGFLDNEDKKVQVKSFERVGNIFIKTNEYGKYNINILKETESIIILTETFEWSGLYVLFINKDTKTFYENYLSMENDDVSKPPKPMKGTCIVKD